MRSSVSECIEFREAKIPFDLVHAVIALITTQKSVDANRTMNSKNFYALRKLLDANGIFFFAFAQHKILCANFIRVL